jgi:hypothetical protein
MIYPSNKQNKISVSKMIPGGQAPLTKEFFLESQNDKVLKKIPRLHLVAQILKISQFTQPPFFGQPLFCVHYHRPAGNPRA